MHGFSIASLIVLALIRPVFTSFNPLPQPYPSQQDTTLRPINVVEFEESMGLQRRDLNGLSGMVLQNHTHLAYGRPEDNGQILIANMTLHAQDGLPIVLLERLNVSVNCRDEEGTLALTFGSTEAFDYAKEQWCYVNKAEDGRFLLIANHDGCGPDDQRQSYIVSNITDDAASLTTFLAAEAAPWSEVAASYDLMWRHHPALQADRSKRGLLGSIENVGQSLVNETEGDLDLNKTRNFPINAGYPNERKNIFTDTEAGLILDCINCYIAGSFELIGYISVHHFKLQDLFVTMSPKSVQAALELEATISASGELGSHPYTRSLYDGLIPDAGISIRDILDLGVTLDYSVGVDCAFNGSATVDFGGNISLPDTAQIVADYKKDGTSSATGLNSSQVTPIFDVSNASASMTLSAFSQPKIQFGIDLQKVGQIDMAVTLQLPELKATFTAEFDEDGACNHSAGALKTGLKIDSEADLEVSLDVNASLGHDDASWSTELWSYSKPLPSDCFPLNLPGLAPAQNTTSVPSVSIRPYISANVSRILPSPPPDPRLGRRWALDSFSLSAPSTGTPSRFDPLSNSSSPDGRLISDVFSRLELALLPTPTTFSTSLRTDWSSIKTTMTSTDLGTTSKSTTVTSFMASITNTFLTVSSMVSNDLQTKSTSTSAAVPISSHMEGPSTYTTQSSSTLLSTTSSNLKVTTSTTLTSSKAKTSETGSLTLLSTTLSSSADTTISLAIKSSTTLSSSVSKSPLSTKSDTTATSSSSVPSKSTSEGYPHASTSSLTTKSQPQLTSTTATPSHTRKSELLDHKSTQSSSTAPSHPIDTKMTHPPPSSTKATHKSHTTSTSTELSPQLVITTQVAATPQKHTPSPVVPSPQKPPVSPSPNSHGKSPAQPAKPADTPSTGSQGQIVCVSGKHHQCELGELVVNN